MKKYRHSILLLFAVFLCIGTFYVKAAVSASPQFILKKQNGNENEAKPVEIHGFYQNDRLSENVIISSTGPLYDSEMSLIGKVGKLFSDTKGNQHLVKEYRSFMRGKTDMNSFFEDGESLVYTNVVYKNTTTGMTAFAFKVSILDKDTKDEKSYQIPIPKGKMHQYVMI